MSETSIIQWILGIIIPTAISISTFWTKINKTKTDSENRISVIESKVESHDEDLKGIKEDLKEQRKDLKLLPELKTQGELTLDTIKEIKEDLRRIKE